MHKMKRVIALREFLALVGIVLIVIGAMMGISKAAGTPGVPSGKVSFRWDYPTNELSTNLTFKLYHSTDLTNWTVLTNVVGTNTAVSVVVDPGAHFFRITSSNFWGESSFSNVALTPPLPRSDVNLKVLRAD